MMEAMCVQSGLRRQPWIETRCNAVGRGLEVILPLYRRSVSVLRHQCGHSHEKYSMYFSWGQVNLYRANLCFTILSLHCPYDKRK